jgi:RNA polymerase sigma-70 factor (ECF subfamily)
VARRTTDGSDQDAEFGSAALTHLDALYGFAMVLARDPETAKDLVQETYLRAVRSRGTFAAGTNLRGWLFVIMRNTWINQLHRHRAAPDSVALDAMPGAGLLADDRDGPDALLVRKLIRAEVRGAIAALAEEHREIVLLRDIEGFSYHEIAAILGCPSGTVMSRLSRARACLRRTLGGALGRQAGDEVGYGT